MKKKKGFMLVASLFVVALFIFFLQSREESQSYTPDETKYVYAEFNREPKDKNYKVSFVVPKGYTYEYFGGFDDDPNYPIYSTDEGYYMVFHEDENDKTSFRTQGEISILYISDIEDFDKEETESRLFLSWYKNVTEFENLPSGIVSAKLIGREYRPFMEKQHFFIVHTKRYVLYIVLDLPYREQYSTKEGITEYCYELLKSLKIEECVREKRSTNGPSIVNY